MLSSFTQKSMKHVREILQGPEFLIFFPFDGDSAGRCVVSFGGKRVASNW